MLIRRFGFSLLLLVVALVIWQRLPHNRPAPPPAATEPAAFAPPPRLVPAPPDGAPAHTWQRLLSENGSPAEDVLTATAMVTNLLQLVPIAERPPLGFNEEIARALTNRDTLGDEALPADHPALARGQLIDRWGTPYQFHPLSANVIEIRSAGPDRRLYTADDIVPPSPAPVPDSSTPAPTD